MLCSKRTGKVFFNGTSLAVILLISAKLVLACQTVVCRNGFESNICAIDENKVASAWYFNLSLAVFVFVTILYFVRNRKGLLTVIYCFVAVSLPVILRILSGNENCDFSATKVAKWMFYVSIFPLILQIVSWIIELKVFRIKIS